MILRAYSDPASPPGYNPNLRFLDQIGFLMAWGTFLLFVNLIAMVIIYERLGAMVINTIPGLNLLSGVPLSAFYGGWIAKIGAAGFFGLILTLYLRFIEETTPQTRPQK